MGMIYKFSDSHNYEVISMHVRAILLTEVPFMMTHLVEEFMSEILLHSILM